LEVVVLVVLPMAAAVVVLVASGLISLALFQHQLLAVRWQLPQEQDILFLLDLAVQLELSKLIQDLRVEMEIHQHLMV